MLDFQIIKKLVLKLSDLIVKYNEDLKKGVNENIIPETYNIINEFIKYSPILKNLTNTDVNLGLNLAFTGITGKILFPAI